MWMACGTHIPLTVVLTRMGNVSARSSSVEILQTISCAIIIYEATGQSAPVRYSLPPCPQRHRGWCGRARRCAMLMEPVGRNFRRRHRPLPSGCSTRSTRCVDMGWQFLWAGRRGRGLRVRSQRERDPQCDLASPPLQDLNFRAPRHANRRASWVRGGSCQDLDWPEPMPIAGHLAERLATGPRRRSPSLIPAVGSFTAIRSDGTRGAVLWQPRGLPTGSYFVKLEDVHGLHAGTGKAAIVH